MRFYFFLALLLAIASEAFAIFGGQDAVDKKFPYQVQIVAINKINGSIQNCGGVILSEDYVLTTAYCVFRNSDFTIRYNSSVQGPKEEATGAFQSNVTRHGRYNEKSRANDIAVIKVSPKIKLNNVTAVVATMPTLNGTYDDLDAVTSGFGDKGTDPTPVYTLQFAPMKIVSKQQCINLLDRSFDPFVEDSNVCAKGNARNCKNDNGNPLVLNNGTLVGLYSWGPYPNCETDRPNVFTKVPYYIGWIKNVTGTV